MAKGKASSPTNWMLALITWWMLSASFFSCSGFPITDNAESNKMADLAGVSSEMMGRLLLILLRCQRGPESFLSRDVRRIGSEFLGKRHDMAAAASYNRTILRNWSDIISMCIDEKDVNLMEPICQWIVKNDPSIWDDVDCNLLYDSERNSIPEASPKKRGFGAILLSGKRMKWDGLNRRALGSEFLGKRALGSEFLGKRGRLLGSEFLGKRAIGREFLGKRSQLSDVSLPNENEDHDDDDDWMIN